MHITWETVLWTNPRTLQREPLHDDHLLACAFTGLLAGAPLGAAYVGAQVQVEREREPEHAHNAQANSNAPRRRM